MRSLVGPHITGVETLLRMRGQAQFSTERGQSLLRHWHSYLVDSPPKATCADPNYDQSMRTLQQKLQPSETSKQWVATKQPHADERSRLLYIRHKAIQLMATLQDALTLEVGMPGTLPPLMLKLWEVDDELRDWAASVPSRWRYQEIQADIFDPSDDDTERHHEPIHVYSGLGILSNWNNFYRCTRLNIHQMLVQCYDQLQDTEDEGIPVLRPHYREQSISIIQTMICDICATIPFSMGDIDSTGNMVPTTRPKALGGYALLASLQHISQCRYVNAREFNLAVYSMKRIGHTMGIKSALNMVEVAGKPVDELKKYFDR